MYLAIAIAIPSCFQPNRIYTSFVHSPLKREKYNFISKEHYLYEWIFTIMRILFTAFSMVQQKTLTAKQQWKPTRFNSPFQLLALCQLYQFTVLSDLSVIPVIPVLCIERLVASLWLFWEVCVFAKKNPPKSEICMSTLVFWETV